MSTTKQKLAAKVGIAAIALAVPLVKFVEGRVHGTYRDPIGIITSCTGHVDPTLRLGQQFSDAECDEQLYQDLLKHADDLNCITVPLKDHETAALLSFSFSVGRGKAGVKDGLCVLKNGNQSTIVRSFNGGNSAKACASISDWTGAGGLDCALPQNRSTCGGIVARRGFERALCEGQGLKLPGRAASS